jgi:hypothetical protein
MRLKSLIVSIPLFLSILMLCISWIKQKAEWKGTIEEKNGVTVVKNPKEPMFGEDIFSIEEELSIGAAKEKDEYIFSQIRDIDVDNEERIYVLDVKEAHVKVFDNKGEYIKTIGKKGQGPGELELPFSMAITGQNKIIVNDVRNRRLAFFSAEGEFIKNLSTARAGLMRLNIDSAGNIISIVIVREEDNPRYELRKFDPEMNYLLSLDSSPLPGAANRFDPFEGTLIWDITKNNQVVCGFPKNYELKIVDSEGRLTKKIMKEYDPVEITEEEIEEVKKLESRLTPPWKLAIPKRHNAYRWFIVDDESRIFVMTWEKAPEEKGYYYDIFDPEGRYITKIPLKHRPITFKKNKLYTIEEDEEGYQVVKRYKVIWRIE